MKTDFKKIVLFASLMIMIIIGGVLLFNNIMRKSAQFRLFVAPSNAKISIGNEDYSNGMLVASTPGVHTATISADGFKAKTVNLTLSENQTSHFYEYLIPDDSDLTVYEESYDDLYLLREYALLYPDDSSIVEFLTKYDEKAKIKDTLPLIGNNYYIFYEESLSECKRLYCIEIGARNKSAGELAEQDLQKHGFNLNDYQIIYVYDKR